jgi:hypothetical protein
MKLLIVATTLLLALSAQAKLPAPVMDDAAKAKAAEAKAKADYGNKVAAYKLCLSQDKAASAYFKNASMTGKVVKPAVATPPCVDPGPFVAEPAAAPAAAAPAPKS